MVRLRSDTYCKYPLRKHQSGYSSHQFQHPGAPPAGGKAAEQPEQHDCSSSAGEGVRCLGGAVGDQQHVGAQHELPP